MQDRQAIIEWNNTMQDLRLSEMAPAVKSIWKTIFRYVPSHRPVYTYFDVYDLEEQRACDGQPCRDADRM